ncbi:MAG: 23S rRNA (pseudouridine(1915)-N(3))-methyltransferase RlmH [Ruminococcaceae bacterium]|nr:23S rRNA (pseudouridine(1915)-N(3))-methyltransferase RlmH [Oscillospiraceae bacterium]
MMNIILLCIGKLKEAYLREACKEYEKRLSGFCRFTVEELEAERLPDAPSDSEILNALEKEGQKILKKIPSNAYVYTMCIEGKQKNSEEFAEILEQTALKGFGTAVFIIGSSYGLSDSVKSISDNKLSMSKMTFPHQLARVMLMEQIYRGYSIINNRRYHK